MLRGVKDVSWKTAKGMMSDPAFLRNLQEMNCDLITLKQQQAVRAHLKKTDKLEQMQVISRAGYGLYKFVVAVLDYCTIFREVLLKLCELQSTIYLLNLANKVKFNNIKCSGSIVSFYSIYLLFF